MRVPKPRGTIYIYIYIYIYICLHLFMQGGFQKQGDPKKYSPRITGNLHIDYTYIYVYTYSF